MYALFHDMYKTYCLEEFSCKHSSQSQIQFLFVLLYLKGTHYPGMNLCECIMGMGETGKGMLLVSREKIYLLDVTYLKSCFNGFENLLLI